jgi:hypothetical protein
LPVLQHDKVPAAQFRTRKLLSIFPAMAAMHACQFVRRSTCRNECMIAHCKDSTPQNIVLTYCEQQVLLNFRRRRAAACMPGVADVGRLPGAWAWHLDTWAPTPIRKRANHQGDVLVPSPARDGDRVGG